MRVPAAVLVVAAALCVVPVRAAAGDGAASDVTPERWRTRLESARRAAGDAGAALANALERQKDRSVGGACAVRRLVLVAQPDRADVRKAAGWERREDGAWERNEAKRLALAETVAKEGVVPPGAVRKRIAAWTKTQVAAVTALARQATGAARRQGSAAPVDDWGAAAAEAWALALALDPRCDEAHRALGHPTFEGVVADPGTIALLARRKEGEARLRRLLATDVGAKRAAPLRYVAAKVPDAGGATAGPLHVTSWSGDADALDAAVAGVRGTLLALDAVGLERTPSEALGELRLAFVEDEEVQAALVRSWKGIDREKALAHLERFSAIHLTDQDELLCEDERAAIVEGAVQSCVRRVLLGLPGDLEADWFHEAVATDVALRVTGTVISEFEDEGRYADETRDFEPAADWATRARWTALMDLDPPFAFVQARPLNGLTTLDTLKAWGVWRTMCETDAKKARAFARRVEVVGTERALLDAFEMTVPEMDAAFRRWALLAP